MQKNHSLHPVGNWNRARRWEAHQRGPAALSQLAMKWFRWRSLLPHKYTVQKFQNLSSTSAVANVCRTLLLHSLILTKALDAKSGKNDTGKANASRIVTLNSPSFFFFLNILLFTEMGHARIDSGGLPQQSLQRPSAPGSNRPMTDVTAAKSDVWTSAIFQKKRKQFF